MSTLLQEQLAEAIVANKSLPRDKRKNKKELLVSAGYSPVTAGATPSVILDSKGVKEALATYGLTERLITEALVADIKGKPKRRVKELSLGADILGMKEERPNEAVQHQTVIIINTPNGTAQIGIQPKS